MTYPEAIKILNNVLEGRKDKRGKTETDYAIDLTISAMEKQIPKKPKLYRRSYWCSDCEGRITFGKKYCGNCGKAIDWSDEE